MKYSKDHIWALCEKGLCKLGLSSYGNEQIGHIVHIQMPNLHEKVQKGNILCLVESSKSATELIAPFSCEIVALNEKLQNDPLLINSAKEEDKWICSVIPLQEKELQTLLTLEQYQEKNRS